MTHTITPTLLQHAVEPFDELATAELGPLLDRIGDARVVLLGEATHGTSEFYRMRARITRELIEHHGFSIVAVEADWPDAARIDDYVRHLDVPSAAWIAFARFPTWMWRNEEVLELVEWLRSHNARIDEPSRRVGFYGLDLYSMYTSIAEVLRYLDRVDPETAQLARLQYACLAPWEGDPAGYGRAAVSAARRDCEDEVTATLLGLLRRRLSYAPRGRDDFLDAVQNARLVKNAEQYYRVMYHGSRESWNLRDTHMFDTLRMLLEHRDGKAVVWEHNSHIGDASATEMGAGGEINVGHLCRRAFGDRAYLIGFGTDHGTVAAAHDWDEPMQVMPVRPARPDSYEGLCHEAGHRNFFLPLRRPHDPEVREALLSWRLERAIGVVYRPQTERWSHYFEASLPRQFDEYVWLDETHAVTPLRATPVGEVPETYPFGI